MTNTPEFALFISFLHWLLCARIYMTCVIQPETVIREIRTTEPKQLKQPETVETVQLEPMIDGVVDWGCVDKTKSK